MDAFRVDFFSRGRRDQNQQQPSRDAEDDDRVPLSPRPAQSAEVRDLESQQEMTERPATRFMPRIPSFFSVVSSRPRQSPDSTPRIPRPSSSRYSGEGGTDEEAESPKTPRFRIGAQTLPSTRLHLPNLTRTWTQGSNGPPSRPGTAHSMHAPRPSFSRTRGNANGVQEPVPVMPAEHVHTHGAGQAGHARQSSEGRRRFNGADPAEAHLADMVEDGRQRRHRREGSDRSHRSERSHRSRRERESQESMEEERVERRRRRRERQRRREREQRPTPKHFLFCFPWVKSRRIRNQILRCFVSGLFLTLLLSVYLALSITKNINNSEFTVLLILIILFVTIFFCHGLIRLCILIVKGPRDEEQHPRAQVAQLYGPGGYAIPRQPIRVVLARDEEAAGIESEATKINPPAYGLWRESVRVDPNRIFWMRNEEAPATVEEENTTESSSSSSHGSASEPSGLRRPPSYASDDGVSYVVEAQPRSTAPTTDVPVAGDLHPSERGRAGHAAGW
ncbi:hypothetical protein GQ53DRAFT_768138 [Thozetella sp. PMI_491]|nr:hypothetical protein GQ53DRAFT_768138 [Thozetella sp. PMI_491]